MFENSEERSLQLLLNMSRSSIEVSTGHTLELAHRSPAAPRGGMPPGSVDRCAYESRLGS